MTDLLTQSDIMVRHYFDSDDQNDNNHQSAFEFTRFHLWTSCLSVISPTHTGWRCCCMPIFFENQERKQGSWRLFLFHSEKCHAAQIFSLWTFPSLYHPFSAICYSILFYLTALHKLENVFFFFKGRFINFLTQSVRPVILWIQSGLFVFFSR